MYFCNSGPKFWPYTGEILHIDESQQAMAFKKTMCASTNKTSPVGSLLDQTLHSKPCSQDTDHTHKYIKCCNMAIAPTHPPTHPHTHIHPHTFTLKTP